jgi:hypothetical protein
MRTATTNRRHTSGGGWARRVRRAQGLRLRRKRFDIGEGK